MAEQIFSVNHNQLDGQASPGSGVIGEQHVKEDMGWVPSMQDWLKHLGT